MSLQDKLRAEDADAQRAAQSAMAGRSLTGLSGRHTEMPPIVGARVEPPRILRIGEQQGDNGPRTDVGADRPPLPQRRATLEGDRIPFEDTEQKMAWPPRPGYRR